MKRLYPLGLFEGFGIELEYMIVDRETLDVRPIADRVLETVAGEMINEVELGDVAWSNELVLHVLEMKTNGPAESLDGLAARFQENVVKANEILLPMGACLLPTGMHPWMDPQEETRLWPHEMNEVYRAYDRIFGCRGHGWSNLQATHINLPFSSDEDFVRLHEAIRVVIPLIPAIAASSPIFENRVAKELDTRLHFYRRNQARVPIIVGDVVPESIDSIASYKEKILESIYCAIAPYDPDGVLQHEWLNSRGAIARFERGAIEIRMVDIQEAPRSDLAMTAAIVGAVRALATERWASIAELGRVETKSLHSILLTTIQEAEAARVDDEAYLRLFGLESGRFLRAGEIWGHLIASCVPKEDADREGWTEFFNLYAAQGTLARRIVRATGKNPEKRDLESAYRRLLECLDAGRLFDEP